MKPSSDALSTIRHTNQNPNAVSEATSVMDILPGQGCSMQTLNVYKLRRQEMRIDTILYVEGHGNYSIIHSTERKPLVLGRSLLTFEQELFSFVRIHKKYLLNPQFVATYQLFNSKQLTVTLTGGEVLVVSKRRIPLVLALFTQTQSNV